MSLDLQDARKRLTDLIDDYEVKMDVLAVFSQLERAEAVCEAAKAVVTQYVSFRKWTPPPVIQLRAALEAWEASRGA